MYMCLVMTTWDLIMSRTLSLEKIDSPSLNSNYCLFLSHWRLNLVILPPSMLACQLMISFLCLFKATILLNFMDVALSYTEDTMSQKISWPSDSYKLSFPSAIFLEPQVQELFVLQMCRLVLGTPQSLNLCIFTSSISL